MLNPSTSEYFDATKKQALEALRAYPQGMQIGGGVTAENAKEYLDAGASHVIVTSYVFRDGEVKWENLQKLKGTVGKERIVLDCQVAEKRGFLLYCDKPMADIHQCEGDDIIIGPAFRLL